MEETNTKETTRSGRQTSASISTSTSEHVQHSNQAKSNQSNDSPSATPQGSTSYENIHQVNAASQTNPLGPTSAFQAPNIASHHSAWPTHTPNLPYPVDPYHSLYPPRYEEEDGPGPFLQGVSLVTLGGALGLTAAAAVRWLNGGEFQLLPPPSLPGESAEIQNTYPRPGLDRFKEEEVVTDDEGEEEFEDDGEEVNLPRAEVNYDCESEGEEELLTSQAQEKLLEHIESISESMKTNVSVQEKILQKLTSQGSSITNQSMNLLRASNASEKKQIAGDKDDSPNLMRIWSELIEIKAELRCLQQMKQVETKTGANLSQGDDDPLATTLARLNKAIDSTENFSLHFKRQDESLKSGPPSLPLQHLQQTEKEIEEGVSALDSRFTEASKTLESPALRDAVNDLAEKNDALTLRAGCQLLYLYVMNLAGNPKNPRYRKIFTTNESFQKVEAMNGGKRLLLAVGFEEKKNCLEWLPNDMSPESEGLALAKLKEAATALALLKTGTPSPDLTRAALAAVAAETNKVDGSSND